MKIGLVRHFKVKQDYPSKKLVGTHELLQWFKDYEEAEVEISDVDLLGIEWKDCYSSDSSRAIITAESIFKGEIFKKVELREIPIPKFKRKLKLPFIMWAILSRVTWIFSNEEKEGLRKIKLGLNKTLDEIKTKNTDTLIVSHGALMFLMERELKKRGFGGPKIRNPRNGMLYLFENEKRNK